MECFSKGLTGKTFFNQQPELTMAKPNQKLCYEFPDQQLEQQQKLQVAGSSNSFASSVLNVFPQICYAQVFPE